MRTLIILMATIVFVAKGLAQNKTADLEQSFMANLKLVGKEEATTITPDSVVVVKYYKPARKKGLYQFDLYRVEEYYTPNSSPENLKKRSIMAATHVLITMKEGAGAVDLQGIFSESLIGTPKRIPNSNTYFVPGFDGVDIRIRRATSCAGIVEGPQFRKVAIVWNNISEEDVVILDLLDGSLKGGF